MNRRELIQSILGTSAAAALLKPSLAMADKPEVKLPSKAIPTIPAQTIPPCVVELKRATDGMLLWSAPLQPDWVIVSNPGDTIIVTLNIEVD